MVGGRLWFTDEEIVGRHIVSYKHRSPTVYNQ